MLRSVHRLATRRLSSIPPPTDVPGVGAVPDWQTFDLRALQTFLRSALDGFEEATTIEAFGKFSHGQSNPTFFLRTSSGAELVLRKQPPGKLLPGAHAVQREFAVQQALAASAVSVPRMLLLHDDSSVIGTPFYLMNYQRGRLLNDILLPELSAEQRGATYDAMLDQMVALHSVDVDAVGLTGFGKSEGFLARQVRTWTSQYNASRVGELNDSMERLMAWLPQNVPQSSRVAVVHGDFRLDNMLFHAEEARVEAVLDWELSTLGDPLADLAYNCMPYYTPPSGPLPGFGINAAGLSQLGLPTEEEYIAAYAARSGLPDDALADWQFYLAFSFFRASAILQGVMKRHKQGIASSPHAEASGKLAPLFADIGWQHARAYDAARSAVAMPAGAQPLWGNGQSSSPTLPRAARLLVEVKEFMREEVMPKEAEIIAHGYDADAAWKTCDVHEQLAAKAKAAGLWNLFMPLDSDPTARFGAGLTNEEYAPLCEVMGRSLIAPEVFNCQPPDTGNMEVLARYGTDEQQQRWLQPLLAGDIRSCFAMTEPAVASSDATNIRSSIVRDGDSYVLNGHKWYISGALDPRTELCIFMGKTDPTAELHKQQSMILVDMASDGLEVARPMGMLGFDDSPHGHAEVFFNDVRVPASNLLLGEGRGFEIAQGRLGPGRIHHCMRLIGMAERALEAMCKRALERTAFGKPIAEQGTIQADIAHCRNAIDQARLLTMAAARSMDRVGNRGARAEIAQIKVVAPLMAQDVLDRAIQAHGAAGVSQDTPLAHIFAWARALRLADGPDEVHRGTIAKLELRKFGQ